MRSDFLENMHFCDWVGYLQKNRGPVCLGCKEGEESRGGDDEQEDKDRKSAANPKNSPVVEEVRFCHVRVCFLRVLIPVVKMISSTGKDTSSGAENCRMVKNGIRLSMEIKHFVIGGLLLAGIGVGFFYGVRSLSQDVSGRGMEEAIPAMFSSIKEAEKVKQQTQEYQERLDQILNGD
jgi:hypothetical protein